LGHKELTYDPPSQNDARRTRASQAAGADLSTEQLLEELAQIQQFVLLYPPQGEKGPPRTAYVLSQQTLAQQALVKALGLERWHRSTPRG
jgi:hypothetical protein